MEGQIRLTDVQRRIVHAVQCNAELSEVKVAESLGLRAHTVRYHLKKLTESGLLSGPRPFINMHAIGYQEYTLYLSVGTSPIEARESLVALLVNSQKASWVTEMMGKYDYAVSIFSDSILDVIALLNDISLNVGNIIADKALTVRTSFHGLGRGYLCPDGPRKNMSYGLHSPRVEVDTTDLLILHEMARGVFRSATDISRKTGIPTSTVERRRKALEDSRVIEAYFYRVESSLLGMRREKILIGMKGINTDLKNELIDFAEKSPWILFFVECVGPWDYEFGIEATSNAEIRSIVDQLYDRFGESISFVSVYPVSRYLKYDRHPRLKKAKEGQAQLTVSA